MPELRWEVAVGMRKADDALVAAIDAALDRMLAQGIVSCIYVFMLAMALSKIHPTRLSGGKAILIKLIQSNGASVACRPAGDQRLSSRPGNTRPESPTFD